MDRRLLPGAIFGLTVAFEIASVALSWGLESRLDTVAYAVYAIIQAAAGALIAARHPRNPIGWLFAVFALVNAVGADAVQGWALRGAVEGWPGVELAELVSVTNFLLAGTGLTLTFLLFPDGRLPGRRWRPVAWAAVAGLALALPGWGLSADRDRDFSAGRNPYVVEWLPTGALAAVGLTLFLGSFVASGASLVIRYRRSADVERQQLKWFVFAAALAAVAMPTSFALWYVTPLAGLIAIVALTALPVSACVAILRYRLYDIDVIVDRAVSYTAVTIMLAAVYVVTALLVGTSLGRGSNWTTAAATLVAAVAFRPVRDWTQNLVDRRFHRARYDAVRRMAGFLDDLRAGRAAPDEVEDLLRDLTGDAGLRLLVFLPASRIYVDRAGVPSDPPTDGRRTSVERGGEPLGVVLHAITRHDDAVLLRSLIEAGGLAIEITRLNVELRRQLAEIQASRARIVTAANEERRRLERDLHDGAQQRLVSIGLALRHAQHELGTGSPGRADSTLDEAVTEVAAVIDELRELARGLPPAQLDAGLAPAFQHLARRAPVPVRVEAPPRRFDRGLEGAAYFIGCEGLTNAVKHAGASRITLTADHLDGRLVVRVSDDGVGGAAAVPGSGLSGLADRVAALGGVLTIDSRAGAGTTLTAELPCES